MKNVKELSDKDLIKLYKKNSSETINILMILNAKENLEIVRELKKRGLFKNLEETKKIEEEIDKLNNTTNERLKEENQKLTEALKEKELEKQSLEEYVEEYLLVSSVVNILDKGEYLRKRDFEFSYENIEELDDLYTSLIKELHTFFKTSSVKSINISDVIDYSCKYLDKRYRAAEEESEEDEAPVEGMKHYF